MYFLYVTFQILFGAFNLKCIHSAHKETAISKLKSMLLFKGIVLIISHKNI